MDKSPSKTVETSTPKKAEGKSNPPSAKSSPLKFEGDGDRVPSKRSHNSELEVISINSMIDQLLNMSAQEGARGSPAKKERCETDTSAAAAKRMVQTGSKFFPLRIDAQPFNPKPRGSVPFEGPNEEKIKELLAETGYSLTVTPHQRLYGGPPPNWKGPPPTSGCQVFVGRIPKQLFEDTLVPLFQACGKIWSMRLMMEGTTPLSRGYGFVVFCTPEEAKTAQYQLDEFEVMKGRPLKVAVSEPFCRLFLGNIPKCKTRDELMTFLACTLDGVMDVITYSTPDEPTRNRGFCFIDFDTHEHASIAKKKFTVGSLHIFGCKVLADWADPQQEPDYVTMASVKVLYVRGLTRDVTEADLTEAFKPFGTLERVKKLKDYAFVHFKEREEALKAMSALNGTVIKSATIEVTLAKPPIDRCTREEILKNRERRLMANVQSNKNNANTSFKQLSFNRNDTGLKILDGKVIICGPKVTVLVKDN